LVFRRDTLQIVAQKHVQPALASLVMSLESVFAVLSGWLILDETLSQREIIGCVLMFAAILLAQIKLKKE
jgi:drug/metabolite transporter (DMT)-like permease